MRLIKMTRVYLITLGLLVFTAGSARAGVIEEWAKRYNGPGNGIDTASAIAVDGSGNVYVTGGSPGSGTGYDYATIKYGPDGNEVWIRRYDGPENNDDYANAITMDSSGNIYITGRSYSMTTFADYATIKYDTNGAQKWVARYNGPVSSHDYANAIAVDSSGNVYVTGQSIGGATGYDYATIKYNSAGTQQWIARYDGSIHSNDYALAIAVDGSGNVYVTGQSAGTGTGYDYATIKYNSAGTQQWIARYNGPGNTDDVAEAIAVDGSGNIYVTGQSVGSGTANDYATIKYNSAGAQQWVARYNGPGNGNDVASAIALDSSNNIYVTGQSVGSGTAEDYATIKYNSAGTQQWVARYNGPGNGSDIASDIVLDGSGNIYVTGSSSGSGTGYDYATIKYNSAGTEQWVIRYNGPDNGDDYAHAIAVNSDYVYVTGGSTGSGTGYDYATIKYNPYPPFILTMRTEPPEVNTVTPPPGDRPYAQNVTANISARRFVGCPDVYVFSHWEGDVDDPNSANTTIIMDSNETVTAVFVDGRQCGDECHSYPDGDTNKDCVVNFSDFALFASHWLECTKPQCD